MPIAMNFDLLNHCPHQDKLDCNSNPIEIPPAKSPLSNGTNRPSLPPPVPATKPRLRPVVSSTSSMPVRLSRKVSLEQLTCCQSTCQISLPPAENEKWLALASSSEHILVGGGNSNLLRLFDYQGKELRQINIDIFAAFDLAWSNSLNAFLIAGYDRFQTYSVETNQLTPIKQLDLANKKDNYFWSIACHGNDLFIVLSDGLESIWRISLPTFKRLQTLSGSEIRESNVDDRISCIRTNGHSIAMTLRQRETFQWRVDLFDYNTMNRTHRGLTMGNGVGAYNFLERSMLASVDDHQWLIIGGYQMKPNALTLMDDRTGEIRQVERTHDRQTEYFTNICTTDFSSEQQQQGHLMIIMMTSDEETGQRQIHLVKQQQQQE